VLGVSDQWAAHRPHQALALALFLHARQGCFSELAASAYLLWASCCSMCMGWAKGRQQLATEVS